MISMFLGQEPTTGYTLGMRYRFLCIYCNRQKRRLLMLLMIIISISIVTMAAMNLYVNKLKTNHYKPDIDVDRWWPNSIKVKGRMATWHWSTLRRGTVYKMDNGIWTIMDSLCKSKENYIRHKFLTPGGDATVFFSAHDDLLMFDEVYKHDLLPTMHLMSQDSTLTFIDIGADDGMYSLVVAAMGNEVLAIEPYVKNVPKLCQGIKASDLSGRCYVVANAVLDESDEPVLIKSRKGKPPTVYKVTRDLSGPGNLTTSIALSDLLRPFPMKKVGIRFGLHHDITSILNSDDEFFDKVDVQFIQMRWDVEAALHHDEYILEFMAERGYAAYGYWESFAKLEDNIATWPENVIFRKDKSKVRKPPLPSKHVVEIEKPIKTSPALKGKPIPHKMIHRRDVKRNVKHTEHMKLRLGQDLERLQYRNPAYRMAVEEMRKKHGIAPVKTKTSADSGGSSSNSKSRRAMPRQHYIQSVDRRHDATRHSGRAERAFLSDQKPIDASKKRLRQGDVHVRGNPVANAHRTSIHTAPRGNSQLAADKALGHTMSGSRSMGSSAHSAAAKKTRGNYPAMKIPRNRMSSLNRPGGHSDHSASATAIGQGQTDRKVVLMRNDIPNSSMVGRQQLENNFKRRNTDNSDKSQAYIYKKLKHNLPNEIKQNV